MMDSLTRPFKATESPEGALGAEPDASPSLEHTSTAGKAVSTIATAAASAIGMRMVRRWPVGAALLAAVSLGAMYLQRRRAANSLLPSDINLKHEESMVA
jgi:hypothetical protein